ncbi:uncharacterized protein [Macrobrachium rosenbergii]|uniref:uncharacterized protein isoform X2 n=1 Tax=Macrobrachium rosenbergii TaxID=79674 RepID=UPI0034D4C242
MKLESRRHRLRTSLFLMAQVGGGSSGSGQAGEDEASLPGSSNESPLADDESSQPGPSGMRKPRKMMNIREALVRSGAYRARVRGITEERSESSNEAHEESRRKMLRLVLPASSVIMEQGDPNLPGPSGYVSRVEAKKRNRRKGIPQRLSHFAEILEESSDEDPVQHSTSLFTAHVPMFSLSKSPTKRKREGSYKEGVHAEVETDILLKRDEGKGIIIWVPKDSHSLALNREDCQETRKISRTVHLDEYFDIRAKGKFASKSLDEECDTGICDDLKGVWFRTGRVSGHNKYGNVRFIIQLNTFLQYLNEKAVFKFYLYEIFQSTSHCASRFIVAEDRDHQIPGDLMPYNYSISGGPWYVEQNDNGILVHKFANAIRAYKSAEKYPLKHEVEFFLKGRENIYSELYLYVHPLPENHSRANDSEGMCYTYQSETCTRSSPCPYALPKASTSLEIEEDWTLETFAMYTAWMIQKQVEEKLLCLGCNEDALQKCGNDMIPILLKVMMQKARQMFAFVLSRNRDDLGGEKKHFEWDGRENMMEEHKQMLEVVNKHVDEYIDVLRNYILSEKTFAHMAESGKMELHMGQMVESMSEELYEVVRNDIESLAVEMKNALQKEMVEK